MNQIFAYIQLIAGAPMK